MERMAWRAVACDSEQLMVLPNGHCEPCSARWAGRRVCRGRAARPVPSRRRAWGASLCGALRPSRSRMRA